MFDYFNIFSIFFIDKNIKNIEMYALNEQQLCVKKIYMSINIFIISHKSLK